MVRGNNGEGHRLRGPTVQDIEARYNDKGALLSQSSLEPAEYVVEGFTIKGYEIAHRDTCGQSVPVLLR